MEQPQIQLFTADEAAGQLRCKNKRVHALVREGKLACVQVSARERLFTPEQIESFIRSRSIPVPKKRLDTNRAGSLPSQRGGATGKSGDLVKADLREEMRQWP